MKWKVFSDKLSSSSSLEHLAVRAVHFPAGAKVWARPTYTFNCDAMKISSAALCQDIKPLKHENKNTVLIRKYGKKNVLSMGM